MTKSIPCAVALLVCLSLAADVYAADWEIIGRQGRMQFVLVPKDRAADRQFFERAAKALCPSSREVCFLFFWTARQYAASRVPLNDVQLNNIAAQYQQNPNTGLRQLMMPCRVDPRSRDCFR